MQRNADLDPLYRRNLIKVIYQVCIDKADFGSFIKTTVADWYKMLESSANEKISLAGWLTVEKVTLAPEVSLFFATNF